MFDYPNDNDFIKTLPTWKNGIVYPGFGLATLAYLNKFQPHFKNYDSCGTIMELFSAYITSKSDQVAMSSHNAHSWAYYDSDKMDWQDTIKTYLPKHIKLPRIVPLGTVIGKSSNGANIHVASGDLQASVASLEQYENTAYVIIGTSAQICCLIPVCQQLPQSIPSSVVILPYSETHILLAACAMNGGSAVETILKQRYPEKEYGEMLKSLIEQLNQGPVSTPNDAKILPVFIKERGIEQELILDGIDQLTDVQLLEETHRGIIANLFSLFPSNLLHKLAIQSIALVGAANENRFKRHIDSSFGFPIIQNSTSFLSTPIGATKL